MTTKYGSSDAFSAPVDYRTSGFVPWKHKTLRLQNSFSLESYNNFHWRSRLGTGSVGGPFYLFKRTYTTVTPRVFNSNIYVGPAVYTSRAAGWSKNLPRTIVKVTDAELASFGTHAIASCDPTNSVADVATAGGELVFDELPRLPGLAMREATRIARRSRAEKREIGATGGEYLNVQFGWLPMVSDVRKFAYAVKHHAEILDQYQRDSGRKVKRTYELPTTVTSSNDVGNMSDIDSNTTVSCSQYNTLTKRTWFEGAFRYSIPIGNDPITRIRRYAKLADKLLGVEIDPETLWNIAPWSWAIDWVTDVGDITHNLVSFLLDGNVMQYGFAMCHQTLDVKTFATSGSYRLFYTDEIKQRLPASPFGFNTDWGSFTPRQLAIVAALGISRGAAR